MLNIIFMLDLLEDPEDEPLFIQVVNKYQKLFYKIALDRVHNPYDAEECCQEALEVIAANFHKIEDPFSEKAKSYMCNIVRNKSIDKYKKEKKIHSFSVSLNTVDEEDFFKQTKCESFNSFDKLELSIMMENLPEDIQTYLVLLYIHRLKLKEISKQCNISLYMLNKKIQQGIDILREGVESYE